MFKRITKLPDDAIRMIAGNDVDTNLVLQATTASPWSSRFEDPRVGNVAIMLTPTAAQRLAITLDAMLTADDATLDAAVELRAARPNRRWRRPGWLSLASCAASPAPPPAAPSIDSPTTVTVLTTRCAAIGPDGNDCRRVCEDSRRS